MQIWTPGFAIVETPRNKHIHALIMHDRPSPKKKKNNLGQQLLPEGIFQLPYIFMLQILNSFYSQVLRPLMVRLVIML